ncbi:hypothetical protein FQN57_004646 [Myotisia sp. PD_48]|nr:hypothetical protein FQN57_004646 [Myotisia sp. PD_48]
MESAPINTLLIQGSFDELAEELARYVDSIRSSTASSQTAAVPSVFTEISPIVEKLRELEYSEEELTEAQTQQIEKGKDEVLKKLIVASSVLNAAPEKEIIAAFNLLVYLIRASPSIDMFLPRICSYLAKPMNASPQNGPSLALSILSNIFNLLPSSDSNRYHVFLAILAVIRGASSQIAFDALKAQLNNQLSSWTTAWELDEEDTRKLHLAISDTARVAGDIEMAYNHLISALQAIPPSESSSSDAKDLALKALTSALVLPFVFDFTPLTTSDAIQNLRQTDSSLFELLEIFAADTLDAYEDFVKSTPISSISTLATLPLVQPSSSVEEALHSKMRLLTLTSLAAAASSRSLPYDDIATGLRVPQEDVEKWVIDTIRAHLVEGKLSQLKREFLVHRATYRVFGEKQWREVQGRLMVWRRSLESVLDVVRSEKEKFIKETAAAAAAPPTQTQGEGHFGGRGGDRRRGGGHHQNRDIELVAGGD